MNKAPVSLDEIARVLELDRAVLDRVTLPELQALVAKQRRVLAAKYHPDQGGDTTRMQEINRVCDHVERSEILHRPVTVPTPPPFDPSRIRRPVDIPTDVWERARKMEEASRNMGRPWGSGASFFGGEANAWRMANDFANFIRQDQAERRAKAEKLLRQAECGTLYPE